MACSDVCGYPRIVHGGLTSAIVDEAFGFLMYALRHHKQLPFWAPAFTKHLEVDFKAVGSCARQRAPLHQLQTCLIVRGNTVHCKQVSARDCSTLSIPKWPFTHGFSWRAACMSLAGADSYCLCGGMQKIQAGKLLLCETEVEQIDGRKLWMTATVRDSPGPNGKVYATARALFVVPRPTRLIHDATKYVMHMMFPDHVSIE